MTEVPSRRPLTGLLVAQLLSVLGTSMSALAIPWLVLTSTGSATRTGLIAFAELAPYVAMQALGGPLVHRAEDAVDVVVFGAQLVDRLSGAALGSQLGEQADLLDAGVRHEQRERLSSTVPGSASAEMITGAAARRRRRSPHTPR